MKSVMKTKKAYLVHVFRHGVYHHTVNLVFTGRKVAEKYADECGEYCQVQQVECISLDMY